MRTPNKLKSLILVSSFELLACVAQAQLGISPSMNSSFLTELRARNSNRAEDGRDVLGETRLQLDTGRELSRPELGTKSYFLNAPTRLSADLTGFNSPYQLGRTWLSPFYNGVRAPQNTISNPEGLTYGLALEQTIDYGSNISGGNTDPLLSPSLLFNGIYQITPEQRFTFAGGIGLNWIRDYWNSSEDFVSRSGLTALPGTSVAYDANIGPVSLTVYDRVSKRPFYGFLQNDLGLAATWQITPQWSWTPNYTFSKMYDVGDRYWMGATTNQNTVSSLLTFESNGNWSAGLEKSLTFYRGTGSIFNFSTRGHFYSMGPFVVWNVSKDTRIRLAVGYQHSETESDPSYFFFGNRSLQNSSDAPYYTLSLSQKLNERWSHELSAGYETTLSLYGSPNKSHYLNYGITRQVCKDGQLTTSAFVERSDTSGIFTDIRTGVDLHYSQRLTQKLSTSVAYSFLYEEDGFGNRTRYTNSQYDHIAGLAATYALTSKTEARLSLQGYCYEDGSTARRISFTIRTQF